MNSTLKAISEHTGEVMRDQLLEDVPVRRCGHMMLSVYLMMCCHATVCSSCAAEVMRRPGRCLFCGQLVTGVKKI